MSFTSSQNETTPSQAVTMAVTTAGSNTSCRPPRCVFSNTLDPRFHDRLGCASRASYSTARDRWNSDCCTLMTRGNILSLRFKVSPHHRYSDVRIITFRSHGDYPANRQTASKDGSDGHRCGPSECSPTWVPRKGSLTARSLGITFGKMHVRPP